MGALAVAMAGVVAAAPVLAIILKPIIVPIYELFGADPSMFATTLLANDMGGYPLAMQMAENEAIGNFSGLILGSMMGPTIVFTIPVALSIIKKEDRSYLGAGILAGLITIPLGCIVGGLVMNWVTSYKLSIGTILVNLIPVIIIAGLIVLGLWFIPQKMIRGFNKFGIGVTVVITFFTAVAVFEYQTGIKFPLMNLMVEPNADGEIPLESGLLVCGQISIVLIGAFPMVKWITKTFERPLERVGNKLGMNEAGSAGLIASLANNIAMFNIMGDMDPKGKILNVAFAVSAAFVFGDHLGFTAGVNSQMIFPVVVGKLTAGITALILANIMSPMLLAKVKSAKGEE
jgi:ethanolamine transporter